MFLKGHQQLIPRQATRSSRPASAEPPSHSLAEHVPAFRFPRGGLNDQKTLRHSPLGVKRVAQQSFLPSVIRKFPRQSGTVCKAHLASECVSIWSAHPRVYGTLTVHNHFYHLELSTSTPSQLYHAIFAMRPLGHVLTTNFRASSKSNRPIPNAMGRK